MWGLLTSRWRGSTPSLAEKIKWAPRLGFYIQNDIFNLPIRGGSNLTSWSFRLYGGLLQAIKAHNVVLTWSSQFKKITENQKMNLIKITSWGGGNPTGCHGNQSTAMHRSTENPVLHRQSSSSTPSANLMSSLAHWSDVYAIDFYIFLHMIRKELGDPTWLR